MDDASIKLGIDARGAVTGEQQYRRSMDSIKKSSREGAQEVDKTSESFSNMSNKIATLRTAFISLGVAFSAQNIIRAGADIQGLDAKLKTVTGSAYAAGDALNYLRSTASRQSVDLLDLSNAYSRLLPIVNNGAITMDEMRLILELSNDNMKAYNLSVSEQQLLFYGLSQTLGSGVVNMENLNQVVEKLPGSINNIAAAFGKTVPEFRKMIEEGMVTAEMFKKPLIEALSQASGAAEELSDTYDNTKIRFSNATRDISAAIATTTGALDALSSSMEFVSNNVGAITTIIQLGLIVSVVRVTRALSLSTIGFIQNELAIKRAAVAQALLAAEQASSAAVMAATNRAAATLIGQGYNGIAVAATRASIATRALSTTMAFFGGPIGLSITAISAAILLLGDRTSQLDEATQSSNMALEAAYNIKTRLVTATRENAKAISEERDKLILAREAEIQKTKASIEALKVELELGKLRFSNAVNMGSIAYVSEVGQLELANTKYKKLNEALGVYEENLKKIQEITAGTNDEISNTLKETKKTVQEISEESKVMADALRKTSDDIKDGFDDMFFDIYRNGRFQMGNLFDGIKDAFARMLAEMTTLAIARPIIVPLVTGLGSAMGLSSSAISGVTQGLGGGQGGGLFSGVGNILGFLRGAVNDPLGAAKFLTNSSASAGVNFAQGLGLGGTGQGIAGALGAGLPGAGVGSLIGNLLGIGNKNPFISGGASIAGAAIGQALIPIPVVGGAIGSIAGQALSGLFGGKTSSKEQGAAIDLSTGQITSRFGLGGNKFSQENFDEVTKFAEFAGAIAKAFGGLNENIFIKSNDRAGIGVGFGSAESTKFFGAGEQAVEEIVKGIASRSGKFTESLQTALDNIDFSNTEEALKDLDFALQFDNLGFAEKKTTQLENALKALNEQVEQAVTTASRLGLEEGKIYQAREQALQQLRDEFNQSVQDRILRITDPNGFALSQLDKEFATIRRDAVAIGADLAEIERAYGLERVKLVEQANEEAIRSTQSAYIEIRRFRESLQVSSSLSGLSPENRRTLALEQFRTVQVRFASGEANFQDVQSSVNNLLEASKDYYSFTEGYFKDQSEALSYLQDIEANAQVQYDAQKALLDENKRQTSLLQTIADGVSRNLQQAVSAGNDSRLLRPGETFQQLSSQFNTKNQLPELLVRQFKLQAGFDFSASQNQSIMFQDYARSNPAALALFNQLVQSVGGIPQYASGGYPAPGLALVGERGAELVQFKSSGSRVYNASETKNILSGSGNNGALQQELASLKSAMVMQEERNADRMDQMIALLANISRNNQRIAYSRKQ